MSLAPQQFCVRWNSYHTNLQTVFPKLLTTENFVDVTLACENRQIKCHKVVLSACSTYFERLLIQNPCKHPIIFMKDMRFSEMQSLVDFMYKGEVNVSQDDLPSLLKSAEALQIRGLCGSDSGGLGSGNSQTGCESDSPIHSSASYHSTSTANKSSEQSKPPPTNDKPISPGFKDTTNSSKPSLLQLSSNHHTDQSAGRSSTERQVAQTPRRTANSEHASTATSTESQLGNNTSVNTNGRNHQRTTSTTTRHMSSLNNINGEAGSTNLLGSGSIGEGSGVSKEETVEEDGLFYGEMENDDMECGDQTEEDLLQTGSTGLPNSDFAIANVTCEYDTSRSPSPLSGPLTSSVVSNEDHNYNAHTMHSSDSCEPPAFIIKQDHPHTILAPNNANLNQQLLAMSRKLLAAGGNSSQLPQPQTGSNHHQFSSNHHDTLQQQSGSLHSQQQFMSDPGNTKRIRRSEVLLKQAADCVSRGQTFQTVSDQFNIPISTIRFFMARKGILPRRKRGRSSAGQHCPSPHGNPLPQSSSNSNNHHHYHNNRHSNSSSSSQQQPASPTQPPYHMAHYKLPDLDLGRVS